MMEFFKDKKNIIICVLTLCLAGVLFFTFHKSRDARNTDNLIMSIGEVNLNSGHQISLARESYDALSDSHKKQVDHLDILQQAESQYNLLVDQNEATRVNDLISSIDLSSDDAGKMIAEANEAYNNLSASQKQYVTEYKSLQEAEEQYSIAEAGMFDEKVKEAAEQLNTQGLILNAEMSEKVTELMKEYNELSDDVKRQLKSQDILNVLEESNNVFRISEVQRLINTAINTGQNIDDAKDAYKELSSEEKNEISNYDSLLEAEKYYDALKTRQDYIDSCVAVSYDDLRRYPDSYKGKTIQLPLVITEAKADGWITDGDIFAVVAGTNNELGVYDKRAVREPRIITGDRITIYGTANGLVKKKTYIQGSGLFGSDLFAKTVEEIEIPAINVVYTSADDLSKVTAVPMSDDEYYYQKGAELAGRLNDYLEKVDERIGDSESTLD